MATILMFNKFTPSNLDLVIESLAFSNITTRVGVNKRVPLLDERGLEPEYVNGTYYYNIPFSWFST